MDLQEGEGTRRALCFQDCQSLLQPSNFSISLGLALFIWYNAPLTLRLELGNVILNRSLFLISHLEISTVVLDSDIQRFYLGLSTLNLSLLCCQGYLIFLHK